VVKVKFYKCNSQHIVFYLEEKVAKWLKEQQEIEAAQKDPGESSGGLLSKIMQEAVEYKLVFYRLYSVILFELT